jgi:Fe2+ transport system protein FeoA
MLSTSPQAGKNRRDWKACPDTVYFGIQRAPMRSGASRVSTLIALGASRMSDRTHGLSEQAAPASSAASQDAWQTAAVKPCLLSDLAIGCRGCVVSVGGETEIKRRLLEMGFCNGACVQAVRKAPLGDPVEYTLRGYHLSLRDEQARHVVVLPQLTIRP